MYFLVNIRWISVQISKGLSGSLSWKAFAENVRSFLLDFIHILFPDELVTHEKKL